MASNTFETIPAWAAAMVGLGAEDAILPAGVPQVNVALNRLRLAEFLVEFNEDADLRNLLHLDVMGIATGIRVGSIGVVEDFPGLAIRPYQLWEYVWLLKVLELSKGDLDVLDLGSPASHLVLLTALAGNRVVSIDGSPAIVDAARQCVDHLQLKTLEPRIGDVRELEELPTESFDRITCCSVLEHLTGGNQERALSAMARVLRPGGVIGLTFDYGLPAPGANIDLPPPHEPPRGPEDLVQRYVREGLCVLGNRELESPIAGSLFRHETVRYTIGSLFLGKPPLKGLSLPRPVCGNAASLWSVPTKALPYLVFQQTTSKRQAVDALTSRLSEATQRTHRLITENQGLREENQGLRDDLLAAKSSLGWMTHHWIRSVLGLSRTIQVARKVRTFLNVLSPKIGVLYQHPPKTLEVPAWYFPRPPVSRAPLIVSIVTPSLNQGNYIERTIQSVISQGYMPLEYIVQDGRSSDGTRDILERYRAFLAQAQSAEDTGQANAINLGFRHASGDIMSYLNADDILLPGTLHYVAEYFATHPGVDVVYGHRVLIDEKEQEIGRWVLPPHDSEILSWVDYVPQETLFWRRRIWERVGGCLNENFRFAMDWDLLLRFREVGGRFARLPRFLGAFRVHPEQKTLSLMREVGIQEINLLLERIHGRRVSQREVEHHIRPYLWKHIWFDTLYRLGVLHY